VKNARVISDYLSSVKIDKFSKGNFSKKVSIKAEDKQRETMLMINDCTVAGCYNPELPK